MTMSELVKVEDLAIDFATRSGTVRALRGVSFTVMPGEALGIVGESGSGKTVACRAVLKLIAANARVRAGRILFEGRDVLAMDATELERFRGEQAAMIFQNPSTHLDPIMTVGRQVGEAMVIHRGFSWTKARASTMQLLEDMQIVEARRRVDAYPHELSGGMRQRVMIAAALACEPTLLIADEPTTALDVTVQAQILGLLRRIRRERRLSVILVSHDLGVVAEMCDRVVVMRDGVVLESGPVDRILQSPHHEYTRRLIASQPALMQPAARRDDDHAQTPEKPRVVVEGLKVEFRSAQGLGGWLMRRPLHKVVAVDGVSFRLRRADTLGIVGESGSGKSSVARAMIGLVPAAGGQVSVDGEPLARLLSDRSLAEQRKMQMVFQDPFLSLNPAFTVAQTLAEPLRQHRLCSEREIQPRIGELMKKVDLPLSLLGRRTTQLSGGQRQRVGIARALALEPEILIADEVTSALDVTIQAQILGLFEQLRREMALTLILISHDLAVVRYLCDEIVVMRHGRVVEHGPTAAVLDSPREDYTRALIAAIPRMSPATAGDWI
jgi:peptide/nickel transport system ATP-binding protein